MLIYILLYHIDYIEAPNRRSRQSCYAESLYYNFCVTEKRDLVDMVMLLLHPINNPRYHQIYIEGPRIRRENRVKRMSMVPPVCAGPSCTCRVSLSALTFNVRYFLKTK